MGRSRVHSPRAGAACHVCVVFAAQFDALALESKARCARPGFRSIGYFLSLLRFWRGAGLSGGGGAGCDFRNYLSSCMTDAIEGELGQWVRFFIVTPHHFLRNRTHMYHLVAASPVPRNR